MNANEESVSREAGQGRLIMGSIPGKKEYVGLVSISLLFATLNVLWLAYTVGYMTAISEIGSRFYGSGHQENSIFFLQFRIGIALVISTVFFWKRTYRSLIISLLALVWIGGEYLYWYLYSVSWLKSQGVTDPSQLSPIVRELIPHVGGFYRGTWWNIIVLLVTVLLFVCGVRILLKMTMSNRVSAKMGR